MQVTVITTELESTLYGSPEVLYELIAMMEEVRIFVQTKSEVEKRFAVIDDEVVWHGGMTFFEKAILICSAIDEIHMLEELLYA